MGILIIFLALCIGAVCGLNVYWRFEDLGCCASTCWICAVPIFVAATFISFKIFTINY